MKKFLSLFLFCALSFGSCGIGNNRDNQEKQTKEDFIEVVENELIKKEEAKEIALQAKREYEKNHNFEKAIELFEYAVDVYSDEEWIYADMAKVRTEIRDYEGAIEDLKKAMELKELDNFGKKEDK